jgi:hypothetical protein
MASSESCTVDSSGFNTFETSDTATTQSVRYFVIAYV